MPLEVGKNAPEFTLVDAYRKQRMLREFLGKKSVLVFYPAAFTGVCTKEMCSFRDSLAAFNDVGAQVVGISVDSPFSNKAFADLNKISFPLLSDFTRYVSSQYTGLMLGLSGINGYATAKRSVFVLDAEGVARYAWISDNPGVEPNYDEILSALASF